MKLEINGVLCESLDAVKNVASSDFYNFVAEYYNENDYVTAKTSGSTGTPKEIRLKKADMKVSANNTNKFFGLNENSLFYLALSPTYIAGKMMIVRALELGARIVEVKPTNHLFEDGFCEPIDLAAFVPSQLDSIIYNMGVLPQIKNAIIGGGKLSERLRVRVIDCNAIESAFETYGMTETCSHVALAPIEKEKKPFEIIGNTKVETDDRDCLVLNLSDYSIGKIITNDIVSLVDNKHFYWRGRYDNVVNTGGIKVFPEEIEPKIATVITAIKFFVGSKPSEKWGEELVLFLEYSSMQDGEIRQGDITPMLIEKLKKVLPYYAIPRKYVSVKQFNYTKSGKLIRRGYIE